MSTMKIAIVAAVLAGVVGPLACRENNRDEQQKSASKAAADTQSTAQKPNEKPDADEGEEGEEGPAVPAGVAPEKPAPQQSAGKQFVYNFDSDTPEQLPAKFHSAKTGGGT